MTNLQNLLRVIIFGNQLQSYDMLSKRELMANGNYCNLEVIKIGN